MENPTLHTQKVTILSRLIKESSLTLEEALLLLQEEDVQESVQRPVQQPVWTPGTTTPYVQPYLYGTSAGTSPLTGVVTTGANGNGILVNTSGSIGVSTTASSFTPSSTFTADLNN